MFSLHVAELRHSAELKFPLRGDMTGSSQCASWQRNICIVHAYNFYSSLSDKGQNYLKLLLSKAAQWENFLFLD